MSMVEGNSKSVIETWIKDFVQMKISKLIHNCMLTLTQCDSFSFRAIRYCPGHSLEWDWDVFEMTNKAV